MEDDSISDEDIAAAAAAGRLRCHNAKKEGMAILRPLDPVDAPDMDRHRTLVKVFGERDTIIYYLELLRRAEQFMEFFVGNVGESVDFPLCVIGESAEAVDEFYDQLSRIEVIVGVLTET
jgi:hypothetical protein